MPAAEVAAINNALLNSPGGVLLAHPCAIFVPRSAPASSAEVPFPFRIGIKTASRSERQWLPLQAVPPRPAPSTSIASERLAHIFFDDLIQQIRHYEHGEPFDQAPTALEGLELCNDDCNAATPWPKALRAALRRLWGPRAQAAAHIGLETWPLAKGAPEDTDSDAMVVVRLGSNTLTSWQDPRPTQKFTDLLSSFAAGAEIPQTDASAALPPRPRKEAIGPWTVTYEPGTGTLTVAYNCGRFLLQDSDGSWWAPKKPISVRLDISSAEFLRDLGLGRVPPEYILRRIQAPPASHPHVADVGQICYGGEEERIASDFRAWSNTRRGSVLVVWALLAAARVLRRGHFAGASNFRSLSACGWEAVNPSDPGFSKLARYPYRRPTHRGAG